MSKLIIVESPGKIKKIKSFLGPDYNVMASVGHICDLAKNSLSVNPSNNFAPNYEILLDKKSIVNNLQIAANTATEIIIAADGDREGEAIAYHLIQQLNPISYKRIVFNEITKQAIYKALESPRQLDINMFYAQQTRRILDRIVGYKLSPILKSIPGIDSNSLKVSLGAGRVQSVVTRLIVDKEREINQHLLEDKSSNYNIFGNFIINKINIKAIYHHQSVIDNQLIFEPVLPYIHKQILKSYQIINSNDDIDIQTINYIIQNIKYYPNFIIKDIILDKRFRHPLQPFITSSLQQEASYKLKFQLKKTMILAQKLYEKGLITYMRTDSPSLSIDATNLIKNYIINDKTLGESYYQYRQFKGKGLAQEAHEAIRPTHIDLIHLNDYSLSDTDEERLYQLIWKRTISSQMKSAIYDDQHILLTNKNQIEFKCTNSMLIFDGFLRIYKYDDNITENQEITSTNSVPIQLTKNTPIKWTNIICKEVFKSPPTRYNEPSLVKKLEILGIGRPSTYAAIISKIQDHEYVKLSNIDGITKSVSTYKLTNKNFKLSKKISIQKIAFEKQKLIPTENGKLITDYLVKNFNQLLDYKFTAKMETLLDKIATGKKIWHQVLDDFYQILKLQFLNLNLDIESSPNKLNYKSNEQIIIGKYKKYGDIIYTEAKYGPVFKIKFKNDKDLFVSADKIKPTDKQALKMAIQFIDYKIKSNKNKIK